MPPPDFDHTRLEKKLVEDFGGEPLTGFGADGRDGDRLMEVRLAKKDDRFRLNRETHRDLIRTDGYYVFDDLDDNLPPKRVDADDVSDILGRGSWHSDRGYEHRFIDVDDIF